MSEERLPGGNAGGAVLVDGTVRRPTGHWTPTIHALLRHLEACGFEGAPRVLGVDDRGREVLTFLAGKTVGWDRPWPAWVHSDDALVQVGAWLRSYHDTVAAFVPPDWARWRTSLRPWRSGDVVGHNDAAPYNAVWTTEGSDAPEHRRGAAFGPRERLVGFVDWDFAAPCSALHDLAFVVFSWVPLHARDVVTAEGFTRFDERPRRLRLLLRAYEFEGSIEEVLCAVRERVVEHGSGLRELAGAGDPLFTRLVDGGVLDALDRALSQLDEDAPRLLAYDEER
jgi:hypothetical protein